MIPVKKSGHSFARLFALCALLALASGAMHGAAVARFSSPSDSSVALDSQDWVTILQDGFEHEFPGQWEVGDARFGYGEYHWGKRDCRPYEGSFGAWAVGGGEDGAFLDCESTYPNHAYSYMTYGPFSLEGAASAELAFELWLNSQPDADSIFWGFSTDGEHYRNEDPPQTGVSGGWTRKTLDLSEAIGEPEVWIAFIFISDASTGYAEGAHVDSVLLRKQLRAMQTPTPTATPPAPQYNVHLPIVVKLASQ